MRDGLGRAGVVAKNWRSASGTLGSVISEDQRANCMRARIQVGIHRCGSQLQRRQALGRDTVGQIAQQGSPPHVSHLIADQFAHVHGLRFQFQRRQNFGIDHVAQVRENGPKPGQADGVADQHAGIHGP